MKNAKKCPKWDLNFSHLKLFYGQIMHFYEDRNLFFIVQAIENPKIKKKISNFFSDFWLIFSIKILPFLPIRAGPREPFLAKSVLGQALFMSQTN